MQINLSNTYLNKNQQSFQSRNPELRFADQVMRNANLQFPRISTTKIHRRLREFPSVVKAHRDYIVELSERYNLFRTGRPKFKEKPWAFVNIAMEDIQEYMIGNCGESEILGKIALALNGIKSRKAKLAVYKEDQMVVTIDHVFNLVNYREDKMPFEPKTDGKSYVVDLWNGMVDYSPKAFTRYESEYAKYLIPDKDGVPKTLGFVFRPDFDIDARRLRSLQKKYPELIIR